MAAANKTVERKIFFYRLIPVPYEDGSLPTVEIQEALQQITALRFLIEC